MVRAELINTRDLTDELTIMEWTEGRMTAPRYKIILGELLDWADDDRRQDLQMNVSVDGKTTLLFRLATLADAGIQMLLVSRDIASRGCDYTLQYVKTFRGKESRT